MVFMPCLFAMNLYGTIFMMLMIPCQVLCDASASTANSPSSFSAFNQQISEVITKLDSILSTCTSQPYGLDHSDSGSQGKSGEDFVTLMLEVRSDVKALRNDLLQLNPKGEEEADQRVSLDELSEKNSADGESECSLGGTELIGSGRTLLQYLQRIDFNIFLGKPTNASSFHPSHKNAFAVDGNLATQFHTSKENTPWLYVDLQVPYLIWEITIRLREASRAGGIRIHVGKDIVFDSYGKPDVRSVPLFASQVGNSISLDLKYTYAGGMCGRHVIIKREVAAEHIVFLDVQGVGFKF